MKTVLLITILALGSPASAGLGGRSTTINFEDEVVEGINRKPLDSVSQISERDAKGRPHLYRKRAGFSDKDGVLGREMRLQQ